MLKFLLVGFLLSFTMLFGAYDVKLGLYKSVKKVRVEMTKLKRSKYKNRIVISKLKRFYRVHAIYRTKKEAKKALAVYRTVFKDAFIAKQQVRLVRPKSKHKVKRKAKVKAKPKVKVKSQPKVIEKDTLKVKINILNAKTLLENKTVYLCYDNGPNHLSDRIVKMVFSKDYVIYNPLKKTSTPVQLAYTFDGNRLILELLGMQMVHEIYKDTSDFIYVQSKVNGKNIHKLRYYFDEQKALDFVSNFQNPALGSKPKVDVPSP